MEEYIAYYTSQGHEDEETDHDNGSLLIVSTAPVTPARIPSPKPHSPQSHHNNHQGLPRSKSFVLESPLRKWPQDQCLLLQGPSAATTTIGTTAQATSPSSSPSSSLGSAPLPAPAPIPGSSHHNLHSVLNLDPPHDSREDELQDPADARVYGVAHMFLSSNTAQQQQQELDSAMPSSLSLPSKNAQISKRSSWVTKSPRAAYPPTLQEFDVYQHIAPAVEAGASSPMDKDVQSLLETDTCVSPMDQDGRWMPETDTCSTACSPMDLDEKNDLTCTRESDTCTPMIVNDGDTWIHASRQSVVSRFPPELLLQIFSHFDPPSRDSAAFLSPVSTTAALRACALVCHWWNRVATRVLWRRPRVYDASRFEKLVLCVETSQPDTCLKPTYPYAELVQHLSLSQTLSEPHRHATRLSSLLTRLLTLPDLHLTTLDLAFCKGVSNFALQRCAHALRSLVSLNLAGGGRSEICIIKVARECTNLKRLGLGWNEAVGDFCVREVGRWCPRLEWIDLSGCWRVGDVGVVGLVRGLSGSLDARVMESPSVPSNAPPSAFIGLPPPPAGSTAGPSAGTPIPTVLLTPHRPTLKHISLSYCTNITDAAIHELVERLGSSLQVVNVIGCGDIGGAVRRLVRSAQQRTPEGGVFVDVDAIRRCSGSVFEATNRKIVMNVPGFVPFYDSN
ncbi:hypothetical protein SpCBS45565_g05833 [Spizellomyces sp. 'palustris']|nr:hypothetical protein SpCBS45565_g05833 [Spizellomyces sp. 'palustris']